jgi:DNA-binding transcriptional ArsR family regulator
MGLERIGPLTDAALARPDGEGPPAMEREWCRAAQAVGNLVFLWAGAVRLEGHCLSWHHFTVHAGEESEEDPSPVTATPAEHVERLLTPLAHASRVRIVQALFASPLSAGQLAEAVGLRGGSLYHHLRELQFAAYVTVEQGQYGLTNLGRQMAVTACVLARDIVVDRSEQGLGLGVSGPAAEPEAPQQGE